MRPPLSPLPVLLAGWGLFTLLLAPGCGDPDRTPSAQSGAPSSKIETENGLVSVYHDFGILDLGTSRTHDFEIPVPDNPYGDVLVEDSYQGDCTCAVGMVMIESQGSSRAAYALPPDQRVVKPGDRVLLRVTLDTKNKEAVDVPRTASRGRVGFQLHAGEFARAASVVVFFHYGIRTPVLVAPTAHVDIGDLPMSRVFRQTLRLSSNIPGKIPVFTRVIVGPKCVAARLEAPADPRAEGAVTLLHVTVTPRPDSPKELLTQLVVSTGLREYPDLRIPVSGSFIQDIEYVPANNIAFNLFDFRKPKNRTLNIVDHDITRPPGFACLGVMDANGNDLSKHFKVSFKALTGRTTRVIVDYLGTLHARTLRATLSLAKTPGADAVAQIQLVGHNSHR